MSPMRRHVCRESRRPVDDKFDDAFFSLHGIVRETETSTRVEWVNLYAVSHEKSANQHYQSSEKPSIKQWVLSEATKAKERRARCS